MIGEEKSKTIAWVDGEVCFTEMYRDWIRDEAGMKIRFSLYQQADEALKKIPQDKPSLVIVNPYSLNPGGDYPAVVDADSWDDNAVGFDLVNRLHQKVSIVMISVNGLKESYSEQYLLDKGVSEVIDLKDMSSRKFYEVLEKYL